MNQLINPSTGEVIPFISADISTAIDNFVITANFVLSDLTSLLSVKPTRNLRGDYVPVRYYLGNETYNLIIEEASASEDSFSVSGRSMTVLLAEPYAQQITYTWHNTTAFDLVTELCTAYGITLIWQISNWTLAEYIADKRYPIDIISELAEEVGAKVISTPSGELLVTKYPVCSPNKLQEQTPDYTLSTAKNIFTVASKFVNHTNRNRLLITTESNGSLADAVGVSIEEDKDGPDSLVKVFTNPIVDSVSLSHASGANVAVFYDGVKELTQTDTLTFTEGKAQLSKPYNNLINVTWYQDVLGELTIDKRGNVTAAAQGLGLAEVTYISRYHQYRVQNLTKIDRTLIAVDDIPTPADLRALSIELAIGDGNSFMDAVVVKTLSNQLALRERAQSELWRQLYDVDEYTLDCVFNGNAMQCARIANVKITNQNLQFNGIIKSVSIKVDDAIIQTITLDRHLIS